MKVAVCAVSYRTDDALVRYVESLQVAADVAGLDQFDVLVVDNSLKLGPERLVLERRLLEVCRGIIVEHPVRNLGYFGALPVAQRFFRDMHCDFLIFSNADLVVEPDFFIQLREVRGRGAVLAPAILSEEGAGFDQNPKYEVPVDPRRLRLLERIYGSALLFLAQQTLGFIREKLRGRQVDRACADMPVGRRIYAAHGAMFIFADCGFFFGLRDFTPFLFGEEIFVAEEARLANLHTMYVPSARVRDGRHASIRLLGLNRRRQYMLESVRFLLGRYFREAVN